MIFRTSLIASFSFVFMLKSFYVLCLCVRLFLRFSVFGFSPDVVSYNTNTRQSLALKRKIEYSCYTTITFSGGEGCESDVRFARLDCDFNLGSAQVRQTTNSAGLSVPCPAFRRFPGFNFRLR